jgi:hypothetical protein
MRHATASGSISHEPSWSATAQIISMMIIVVMLLLIEIIIHIVVMMIMIIVMTMAATKMMIAATTWTVVTVFFFFRISAAHVNTYALDDVTFTAQTLRNVRFDKCDETERPERFRYVDVDDLPILGKVFLKIFRG